MLGFCIWHESKNIFLEMQHFQKFLNFNSRLEGLNVSFINALAISITKKKKKTHYHMEDMKGDFFHTK